VPGTPAMRCQRLPVVSGISLWASVARSPAPSFPCARSTLLSRCPAPRSPAPPPSAASASPLPQESEYVPAWYEIQPRPSPAPAPLFPRLAANTRGGLAGASRRSISRTPKRNRRLPKLWASRPIKRSSRL
jgi:hypothetical protein